MKTSRWVGLALGAAGSLLAGSAYWLVRRPLAGRRGAVTLPAGLTDAVEVIRDRWGVPHIYARNARDLFFAQGFVHAQDRLWQMDFQRRLVAGELSAVMGKPTLAVDRWMRILGLRRVAEQEFDLLADDEQHLMLAYAAGVNACINQGRLPLEFTLLRYRPAAWTPADSLSWSKMISWSISANWESEIIRAQILDRLGPGLAAELEPPYAAHLPLIVPPGVDYSCIGRVTLERARAARPFTGPAAREGLGSNNWVLAGERTDTGRPLLANDMHLLLGLPAIWYENHLSAPGWHVAGVTFPGIPGIVAGHNERVAWGYTNSFADVQDLYVERLRRAPGGVEYEAPDGWRPATVIRETIKVRGSQPVVEEVIVTRHGPIINALASDMIGEQPLALRWISLEPGAMMTALFAMNRARNVAEFRDALSHWSAPVQNVVYADTAGDIGYTLAGRIPQRAGGDGRLPVPGWTDDHEWAGFIPYAELPHLLNPPQGYIATANNRVTDDDYPYWIGFDHCQGDRAQRIVELIESTLRISTQTIQQMHLDQVSPTARTVAALLAQHQTADSELQPIIDLLKDWDGRLSAGSAPAAIYEVLMRESVQLMLAGRLGDLTAHYAGRGPTPALADRSIFGNRSWEWLARTLADPENHWFRQEQFATRGEFLDHALRRTLQTLREKLGQDPAGWSWGQLHKLTLAHPLGQVKPLDRLFNRGPYPLGGDQNTIWAASSNLYDLDSSDMVGPPFRFIADLSDWNNSLGVLAPGQSGQPGSPHYADQIDDWLQGRYHPMPFNRPAVDAVAQDTLWLRPASR